MPGLFGMLMGWDSGEERWKDRGFSFVKLDDGHFWLDFE